MNSTRKIKRRPRAVRRGGQLALGLEAAGSEPVETGAHRDRVVFNDPDPRSLFVGEYRLEEFLRQMGFEHIFAVRELLRSLDLSMIESKYKGGGRRPRLAKKQRPIPKTNGRPSERRKPSA